VDASYDVLCEGCAKTVGNLLKALARDMKKLAPQSRAKKGELSSPTESEDSPLVNLADPPSQDDAQARTPPTVVPRQPPSGPSTRQ
jgi:hypothetical protein